MVGASDCHCLLLTFFNLLLDMIDVIPNRSSCKLVEFIGLSNRCLELVEALLVVDGGGAARVVRHRHFILLELELVSMPVHNADAHQWRHDIGNLE